MFGAEPQESSRAENVNVANANHAFGIYGAIHTGVLRNLSAVWTSAACAATSGFNSALEIAASQIQIDNMAGFASNTNCTPAAFPKGVFHITNTPLSAIGNGTMVLTNFHAELGGTSSTGDIFYDDATSGNRVILNPQGCSASTCKNLYHWASTARGTLDLEAPVGCLGGLTTNFIQDDWNGNTIPCSSYTTGSGFGDIYQDGTVYTNLCASLTKGWCISSTGLQYYSGGSPIVGLLANGNIIGINANLTGSLTTNSASNICGSSSPCIGGVEGATQPTPAATEDFIHFNSTAHQIQSSVNGGAVLEVPQVVASGTSAMGTGAITSGTCASAVTTTATGAATTDNLVANPTVDPTGVTGYAVSASGSLYIQAYITSGNVNFKVCNNTSGSLTPSALTLQWRVIR